MFLKNNFKILRPLNFYITVKWFKTKVLFYLTQLKRLIESLFVIY